MAREHDGTGGGQAGDVAGDAAGHVAGGVAEGGPVSPLWTVMAALVGLDFLLGVAAIVSVPFGRASVWLPVKGRAVYVAHGVIGAALGAGALVLLARYGSSAHRISRLGARTGVAGILVGLAGGLLAVDHPARLAGMALMLLGSLVAGIGYLMPGLEAHDRKERAELEARYPEDGPSPYG